MFVTSDKNLVYQQNIASRRIAIVVLPTQNMPVLREGLENSFWLSTGQVRVLMLSSTCPGQRWFGGQHPDRSDKYAERSSNRSEVT